MNSLVKSVAFICLLANIFLLESVKGASINGETYQLIGRAHKQASGNEEKRVIEIDIDYDENHSTSDEEYDEAERGERCKCHNGGSCALDNDFCVCPKDFTGRLCEIKMEKDNRWGCGHLINGESEYLECAVCKCTRNMLTCSAIANTACNLKIVTQNERGNKVGKFAHIDGNLEQLKGADLVDLLQLVTTIENYAYENYINEYRKRHFYRVLYRDLNSNERGTNRENGLPIINHKKSAKDSELVGTSFNHLVVLKSGNKIMGIYFNQMAQVLSSSSRLRFDFSFLFLFYLTLITGFFS